MSIPVTVVGMGGYASLHHRMLHQLEQEGRCQVVATCDPFPENFTEQMADWEFEARGVQVFRSDKEMLAAYAESAPWVCIAAPVHLHADMHQRAVDAGCPVYIEKPPTLDPVQLEDMIAVDQQAKIPTNVGFNFILQPERVAIKQRIVSGEFGDLKSVRFFGAWGRPPSYYSRNQWAGRLLGPDGRPLMDSCFGNAMSHFVHQGLYWAGTRAVQDFASPQQVRAVRKRARDIEGADTVFAETDVDTGIQLRYAMTHACPSGTDHWEELELESAVIRIQSDGAFWIKDPTGQVLETATWPQFEPLPFNLAAYADLIEGKSPYPATTLEQSRNFVTLNAMLYLSTPGIERLPDENIEQAPHQGDQWIPVPKGLRQQQEQFLQDGTWPQGPRPTSVSPDSLPRLHETLARLRS